ncbi:MAG: GNAT family N-acetyltransferase [Lachnospiraceae bacterium]
MLIELGTKQDIESWMRLVEKVKDAFPGLETREALIEHKNTVLDFMDRASAICAKEQGEIIGILLFSCENNEICFLAVDAEHRRQHVAEKMVSFMLAKMDSQRDVSVMTYRDGVPEGRAARAFYKRIGFTEGKLTEEFGSPVQEFVLKR